MKTVCIRHIYDYASGIVRDFFFTWRDLPNRMRKKNHISRMCAFTALQMVELLLIETHFLFVCVAIVQKSVRSNEIASFSWSTLFSFRTHSLFFELYPTCTRRTVQYTFQSRQDEEDGLYAFNIYSSVYTLHNIIWYLPRKRLLNIT